MYRKLQSELQERIAAVLRERYDVQLPSLAVELPPKIEFGEMALPVAFELANCRRRWAMWRASRVWRSRVQAT